jgi:hypothetical protein
MTIARADHRRLVECINCIDGIHRVGAPWAPSDENLVHRLQRGGFGRVRCGRRRHGEAEQGFIGAPEYGQAGVTPLTDRFGMTAGSTTIPNGRTA